MNLPALHKALLEKRDALKQALSCREEIQIEGKHADHLDEALASSARATAVDATNRNNKLLKEVDHALLKITCDPGCDFPYGLCESCEEIIADERLTAVPWARLCITCQIELEQQEKPGRLSYSRNHANVLAEKRIKEGGLA